MSSAWQYSGFPPCHLMSPMSPSHKVGTHHCHIVLQIPRLMDKMMDGQEIDRRVLKLTLSNTAERLKKMRTDDSLADL